MKLLALSFFLGVDAFAQKPPFLLVEKTENPGVYETSWASSINKTYFMKASGDLLSWNYLPEVIIGIDATDSLMVSTLEKKLFFRLYRSDQPTVDPITADHDEDGIPSLAELTITNTDPLKFSTADNGVSDRLIFPDPPSGSYLDSDRGIEYLIIPNPESSSDPGKIIALSNFEAPDYKIEFSVGEIQLAKFGYEQFVPASGVKDPKKRYLSQDKGLFLQDWNFNYVSGGWQFGFNSGGSPQTKHIRATSENALQILSINPITGVETKSRPDTLPSLLWPELATVTQTYPDYAFPPITTFSSKRYTTYREEEIYFDAIDLAPFGTLFPNTPYSSGNHGWLRYGELLYEENSNTKMAETLSSNRPAYDSTWVEGNPWGIWDMWGSELGASYRRFKFRIVNKGTVSIESPAIATVYFKPENSNEVEELLTVEWDGASSASPLYEVDPYQLKPNEEGVFYINAATMAFELDLAEKSSRLSGGEQLFFVNEPSRPPVAGAMASYALQGPTPPTNAKLAQVTFPGMNDNGYQDSEITMTFIGGAGTVTVTAFDPNSGFQVTVPLGQNLADDFFNSKGIYSGWDWYVIGEQPGDLQVKLEYVKDSKTMSLIRDAIVLDLDIDIDSNNNDGFVFDWGSEGEDDIEVDETLPGKFVFLNTGDVDGVPNWADGFGINPDEENDDQLYEVKFTPFLISMLGDIDLNQVEIVIDYDDTDPALVSYELIPDTTGLIQDWYRYSLPNDGSMRVWAKNADEIRKKESIGNSGDFLPANTKIKWVDFPKKAGSTNVVELYLEGVAGIGKKYLRVDLYYKGELLSQGTDTIAVSLATNVQVECFQFPSEGSFGDNPTYFDYCETDIGDPQAYYPTWVGGTALQVFYKYVRDVDDSPIDFDVYLDLNVPFNYSYYTNPVWEKVSGPSSGGLSGTTSLGVSYENPKKAGLYEFLLKTDHCPDTRAAFLLPGAGGTIDQWLIDEVPIMVAKAQAWEQAIRQVARDNGEDEDDFLDTAWLAIASFDFDYQGLAIVDDNIPTRRYNYTDANQFDPLKKGDGDWNEPSYASVKGLVISRSKIANIFYSVWGRELGHSTFDLKTGAKFNAILRGQWDNDSSQNAIELGGQLYDAYKASGDLDLILTKSAVKGMQTPDALNDLNLWPVDQPAIQNFTFPAMPRKYEDVDEGLDEGGKRGRIFLNNV